MSAKLTKNEKAALEKLKKAQFKTLSVDFFTKRTVDGLVKKGLVQKFQHAVDKFIGQDHWYIKLVK